VEAQLVYAPGLNVMSAPLLFVVDRDPTISMPEVSTTTPVAGQNLTFSVTTALGSGLPEIAWFGLGSVCAVPASLSPTSAACVVRAGNFSLWANVTDSNGFVAMSAVLHLSVGAAPVVHTPASSPPPAPGIPFVVLLGLLVGACIVAVAAVLLWRRRARAGESTPEPSSTSEGPEDEPPTSAEDGSDPLLEA
jgi:hypothetical protein